MRARVVISLAMLALAKVATVYVPVIYKQAVDLISGGPGFAASALIAIVVAYGVVRILQQAFSDLSEFFFARVAQRSIRKVRSEESRVGTECVSKFRYRWSTYH